jgi:hypothetical protein
VIALRAWVVPLVRGDHEAPPSPEARTVPAAPTARHPGEHAAPLSALVPVPEPPFHAEPSVVKRTVAAPAVTAPTATHAVVEVQAMPFRVCAVPLV